jgi:heme-degrading monooxygenase HmoA
VLVIVWEFRVRPERLADFLAAYAPGGDWDLLFRGGEGYLSTELLGDQRDRTRFLTIDRWHSREDFDRFHLRFRAEYEELDRKCEAVTLEEKRIGDFSLPGPRANLAP